MTDTSTPTAAPDPTKALAAAGLPEQFTLEQLKEFLTEEEIAALTEGDNVLELPEDVAAAIAQTETPAATEAEAEAAAAAAPEQAQPPVQTIPVPDTAAAEAAKTAAQQQLAALQTEYDDGELTRAEWQAKHDAIVSQMAQAEAQIIAAQQIRQQNQAQIVAAWNDKVAAHQAAYPDLVADDANFALWDKSLRAVTGAAAYANLPMEKQIELAHRMMADHLELTAGKTIARPEGAKAAQPTAPKGPRTDARPDPVQTLAGIAAADSAAPDDGTFAAIDRMMGSDPDKAESMFSRLTPEQRARFLEAE